MDRSESTKKTYKCIKDLVIIGETAKSFTRGLVYNSYHYYDDEKLSCFINNQNIEHTISDDWLVEYFADVNFQLELL